jgi:hypothetical protein
MVSNPSFTPFISKSSQISCLFNIPGYVTNLHLQPFTPIVICAARDDRLFLGVPCLLTSLTAWVISAAAIRRKKVKILIIDSLARCHR